MGKPWENRKTMGKPWENHGKIHYQWRNPRWELGTPKFFLELSRWENHQWGFQLLCLITPGYLLTEMGEGIWEYGVIQKVSSGKKHEFMGEKWEIGKIQTCFFPVDFPIKQLLEHEDSWEQWSGHPCEAAGSRSGVKLCRLCHRSTSST